MQINLLSWEKNVHNYFYAEDEKIIIVKVTVKKNVVTINSVIYLLMKTLQ